MWTFTSFHSSSEDKVLRSSLTDLSCYLLFLTLIFNDYDDMKVILSSIKHLYILFIYKLTIMSFGNLMLLNKILVDMSPFLSEALSKNGRNMTTFKKFMKQEERKFEIINLNINTVR